MDVQMHALGRGPWGWVRHLQELRLREHLRRDLGLQAPCLEPWGSRFKAKAREACAAGWALQLCLDAPRAQR